MIRPEVEGFPSFKYTLVKTERLLMRAPRKTDFKKWHDIRSANKEYLKPFEPEWSDNWNTRRVFSRRVNRQEKEWVNGLAYSFLLIEKGSQNIIGGININGINRGAAQFASLGYWISENMQGQGLMSEAMSAIIFFSFYILNLERLNAATLEKNEKSIQLLKSKGFEKEGFARQYVEIDGRRQDHILFGLNKTDYS
ncbi:MAG: 30S ribosomal protein S5 alanine N-acetyltransferase [Alphaproteobacteria bacterium]|nr:30S ribosomal protein S5 alanine N-acetyltransferase [Alphaproteobacteria bacterium]